MQSRRSDGTLRSALRPAFEGIKTPDVTGHVDDVLSALRPAFEGIKTGQLSGQRYQTLVRIETRF